MLRRLHAHCSDQRAAHVRNRSQGSHQDIKTLAPRPKREGLTTPAGSGSPMHILADVCPAAGIWLSHIPYKGAAPAVNDLIGGHVPTTLMTWGPIGPYAGGKVACWLWPTASAARWPQMYWTLAEQGRQGTGRCRLARPVRSLRA